MTYNKGDYIYQEGEDTQGVYQVLEGRVKLWKRNNTTNRGIILYLVDRFELFGVIDFLQNPVIRRCAAIAMDNEVKVQCILFSEFKRHVFSDPNGRIDIIESLINTFEINWEKYLELKMSGANQRVFRAIQKLAIEKGVQTKKGDILKGISQQELADYIGVSRQSLTIAMNNFRKEGKIEYDRKQILIKSSKKY